MRSASGLQLASLTPTSLNVSQGTVTAANVVVSVAVASASGTNLTLLPSSGQGVIVDTSLNGQFFRIGNSTNAVMVATTSTSGRHVVQFGTTSSSVNMVVGSPTSSSFGGLYSASTHVAAVDGASLFGGSLTVVGDTVVRGTGKTLVVGDSGDTSSHTYVSGTMVRMRDGAVATTQLELYKDSLSFTKSGYTSTMTSKLLAIDTVRAMTVQSDGISDITMSSSGGTNIVLNALSGAKIQMQVSSTDYFILTSAKTFVKNAQQVDGTATFVSDVKIGSTGSITGLTGTEKLLVAGDVVVSGTLDARSGLKMTGQNNAFTVGDTTLMGSSITTNTSGMGVTRVTAAMVDLTNNTMRSMMAATPGVVLQVGLSSTPVLSVSANVGGRDIVRVGSNGNAGSLIVGDPVHGVNSYNSSVHVLAVAGPAWFGTSDIVSAGTLVMAGTSGQIVIGAAGAQSVQTKTALQYTSGSSSSSLSASTVMFLSSATSTSLSSTELTLSDTVTGVATVLSSLNVSSSSIYTALLSTPSSSSSPLYISSSNSVLLSASGSSNVSLFNTNLVVTQTAVSMRPSNGVLIGASSSGRVDEVLVIDGNVLAKGNVTLASGQALIAGNVSISSSGISLSSGTSSPLLLSATGLSIDAVTTSLLQSSANLSLSVPTDSRISILSTFGAIVNGVSNKYMLIGGTSTVFSTSSDTFGVVGSAVIQGSLSIWNTAGDTRLSFTDGKIVTGVSDRTEIANATLTSSTSSGTTTVTGPSIVVNTSTSTLSASASLLTLGTSAKYVSLAADEIKVYNATHETRLTPDLVQSTRVYSPSSIAIQAAGVSSTADVSATNKVTLTVGSQSLTLDSSGLVTATGNMLLSSANTITAGNFYSAAGLTNSLLTSSRLTVRDNGAGTEVNVYASYIDAPSAYVSRVIPQIGGAGYVSIVPKVATTPTTGLQSGTVLATVGNALFEGDMRLTGNLTIASASATKILTLEQSLIRVRDTAAGTSASLSSTELNVNSMLQVNSTMVTIGTDSSDIRLTINSKTETCGADTCLAVYINGQKKWIVLQTPV
jgi:hypothetical protein